MSSQEESGVDQIPETVKNEVSINVETVSKEEEETEVSSEQDTVVTTTSHQETITAEGQDQNNSGQDVSNLWDDLMKGSDGDAGAAAGDSNEDKISSSFNFDNDFDIVQAFPPNVDEDSANPDQNDSSPSDMPKEDENSDFEEILKQNQEPAHDENPKEKPDSATDVKTDVVPNEAGSKGGVARARPRPTAAGAAKAVTNPFNIALKEAATKWEQENETEDADASPSDGTGNPFAAAADTTDDADGLFGETTGEDFNPFATIRDDESAGFDPFQTIHDDDAFALPSAGAEDGANGEFSFFNDNPFGEPAADQNNENFANFGDAAAEDSAFQEKPSGSFEDSMDDADQDNLEVLPPYYPRWDFGTGWNLLLRQPFKKKLTQNRFWKPAYVRIMIVNDTPMVRIFPNDKDQECLYELVVQPNHNICDLGLQQLDQFGKCHTVKIQQVNYKETVGVKADRIAPTISDLTKVRDLKGLKDLMHKPKATMILDHAANAIEVLKFGSLIYADIKSFMHAIEDLLFWQKAIRGKSATYTKDEITVDVQDEYYADIDKDGHITHHKARVRLFCLAFLSESPVIEVGVNDKRRRGKEIVGRQDIIPIKTEEWIKIEDYELHSTIDKDEFEKTKVVKFNPLDSCRYELLRFRVRPRINIELPLQIRVQMSIVERHIEVRAEVMVTGYYSNSRRAAQTPCEDIQIRFPIPEDWVYLFRVEKRFKYGAVHSSKRKAGKIKGLERLTAFAQGILPPSLIEVSTGLAKYEQAFHAVVWRIDQLPERNEGAYKTHLMVINIDLAPHDKMPEELDKFVHVEYSMANSTVSRAQVRSIAISSGADEPPDRWVRHLARYEYTIEMEFTDKVKAQSEDVLAPLKPSVPVVEEADSNAPKAAPEDDSENSSSDSD